MSCNLRIAGDTEALCDLDRRGLLAGADESVEQYLARIRKLQSNISRMNASLEDSGKYSIEEVQVHEKDRIKAAFFDKANQQCRQLYGFSADWVPAFFINPSFAFLFGGCSFSFLPDFFVMFIIRRSFKAKERWLIYGRDELLAHELCHIARAALESMTYEETFAYQTSSSGFRRLLGGIFLRQADSFILLGSTLLLLLGQIIHLFVCTALPMIIFWVLPLIAVLWLLLRYCSIRHRMSRALEVLGKTYGNNARSVLFRCTDNEIDQLAKSQILPASLTDMTKARAIILAQFGNQQAL